MPRAVNRMNELLALWDAGVFDDYALAEALWGEIMKGARFSTWESAVVEPTGKRSGRCIEFQIPKLGSERLWWASETDILCQRQG
jgi:hypothetical protein